MRTAMRTGRIIGMALSLAVSGPALSDEHSVASSSALISSDDSALRRAYSAPISRWPAAEIDDGVRFVEFGPLPPLTRPDPDKAELGRQLFHDVRLSRASDVSCATCHDPSHGFSSGTARARGHGGVPGRRNPHGLRSVAVRAALVQQARWGWDGRGGSLAEQILFPLTAPDEMAHATLESALGQIEPIYEERFRRTYGAFSSANLADALIAFLATQERPTRFDRFLAGDRMALTDRELRGLHLFRTKARCVNCHFGPLLSDDQFHNLKISAFGEPAQDLGRAGITGAAQDTGRFRTPSLRHVAESAPYMHSGLFASLQGVVNLYDRGGGEVWARNAREAAHPLYPFAAQFAPHIRPLGLSEEEKAALVAFLNAL